MRCHRATQLGSMDRYGTHGAFLSNDCMLNDISICRNDGVGLAAPQVGVNVRLMVFNPTGVKGEPDYVLVNPKIVHSSKKKDIEEEGCLSFPKIYGDVEVRGNSQLHL